MYNVFIKGYTIRQIKALESLIAMLLLCLAYPFWHANTLLLMGLSALAVGLLIIGWRLGPDHLSSDIAFTIDNKGIVNWHNLPAFPQRLQVASDSRVLPFALFLSLHNAPLQVRYSRWLLKPQMNEKSFRRLSRLIFASNRQ